MKLDAPPDPVPMLLERVAALAPLVAEHRAAMDRERRMPAPLFDAIAGAGLLRLWVPRALGGPELSLPDFMRVVEAAAALDGSVGWIVGNGGGMSRAAGYLPEPVARDWFADSGAFVVATNGAVGDAIPVDGGYRVRGRWPYASGIHHASHVATACKVVDGPDAGAVLLCYLPARHARIVDTWQVSGLRGTGSCDYVLDDVFVPAAHAHDMLHPPASQPGPLYRLPHVSVFAVTVSVVPLGIARAALDGFVSGLASRARAGTAAPLRERELIQSEVGRAGTLLAAGRALLISGMHELVDAAAAGGERLIRARADFRAACAHAAQTAIRIGDMLSSAAGGTSIREDHPLERQVRDLNAAARHIAMSPNNYVVAGRVRLGLDPGTPRF